MNYYLKDVDRSYFFNTTSYYYSYLKYYKYSSIDNCLYKREWKIKTFYIKLKINSNLVITIEPGIVATS